MVENPGPMHDQYLVPVSRLEQYFRGSYLRKGHANRGSGSSPLASVGFPLLFFPLLVLSSGEGSLSRIARFPLESCIELFWDFGDSAELLELGAT